MLKKEHTFSRVLNQFMDHFAFLGMLVFSLKDDSLEENAFLLKVWPAQAYIHSHLQSSTTYNSNTNIRNPLATLILLISWWLSFPEVSMLTEPLFSVLSHCLHANPKFLGISQADDTAWAASLTFLFPSLLSNSALEVSAFTQFSS